MKDISKIIPFFQKYKFVLIVILAGALLLMLPSLFGTASEDTAVATASEEDFSVETLEARLATALSEIDGAGDVSVVLTVKSGTKRVLAQDSKTATDDDSSEESSETVVVSTDSSSEEAVLIQQIYPTFQGALVICSGADDPTIKLALTQAVSALTGLGSDKISICKGK